MASSKKGYSRDKSQPYADPEDKREHFSTSAQQQQPDDSFDVEAFKGSISEFFDCSPSSMFKTSDIISGSKSDSDYNWVNGIKKCSFCKKENNDLKNCMECKTASYCDRKCQKADWPQHKTLCRKKKEGAAISSYVTTDSIKKEQTEDSRHMDMRGDSKPDDKSQKDVCYYCNSPQDKLKVCVRCKTAVYCDKECQKAHWHDHKKSCKKIQAENNINAMSTVNNVIDNMVTSLVASQSSNTRPNSAHDEGNHKGNPTNKDSCLFCKKTKPNLIKCINCKIAVYCDERCRVNHRLEHKVLCDNLPTFCKALENTSEIMSDFHGCRHTEMKLPPPPHPLFGSMVHWEGVALLLRIEEPVFHLFRHAVFVKDVNGKRAPMYFYHEKEEEIAIHPKTLGSMLTPGNFIRWFCPQWHFFLDGTVGFRINSLNELEFLQSVTRFTIVPKR